MKITKEYFGILAICALRYCQGRKTYMPSLIQSICKDHIEDFSDKDLGVMIEDCDFQRRMNLYGDDVIDRPGWIEWQQILLAEKERRKNG